MENEVKVGSWCRGGDDGFEMVSLRSSSSFARRSQIQRCTSRVRLYVAAFLSMAGFVVSLSLTVINASHPRKMFAVRFRFHTRSPVHGKKSRKRTNAYRSSLLPL